MSKKKHNNSSSISQPPYEIFMLEIYREIDRVIAKELERLRQEGIVPTCQKGCHFCCRQVIPTTILEARVSGQYIKRNFSEYQRDELRNKLLNWFKWVETELPEHTSKAGNEKKAFYNYGPDCPLLVDGECSIYPVRPVTCRTHYVSSNPDSCRPYTDTQAAQDELTMITNILHVVQPFAMYIRNSIESAGINFDNAMLLLPQWLPMELGWDDLLPKPPQ